MEIKTDNGDFIDVNYIEKYIKEHSFLPTVENFKENLGKYRHMIPILFSIDEITYNKRVNFPIISTSLDIIKLNKHEAFHVSGACKMVHGFFPKNAVLIVKGESVKINIEELFKEDEI